MPYSDTPAGYIVPDDYEWRAKSRTHDIPDIYADGGSVYFCPDYRREPFLDAQAILVYDKRHPKCLPCANRNAMGDRNHNWCYRCPAGLMFVQLHIYDAERTRDRAVRV